MGLNGPTVSPAFTRIVTVFWADPQAAAIKSNVRYRMSEIQFQPELYVSRRAHRGGHDASGSDIDISPRSRKTGRIRKVESLRAELQPRLLVDLELLEQRQVQIPEPVLAQNIGAGI